MTKAAEAGAVNERTESNCAFVYERNPAQKNRLAEVQRHKCSIASELDTARAEAKK